MSRDIAHRAEAFWIEAGISPSYPVDIGGAVCLALPVGVVLLPHLTAWTLTNWLGVNPTSVDRRLHGALLARRGRGLVFVDGCDSDEERRITIAHECAHFILDYMEPRQQSLAALGPEVRDVLDGDRSPTVDERVDSLLVGVTLGTHVHLMERDSEGRSSHAATVAELSADLLSFELIAPAERVRRESRGHRVSATHMAVLLQEQFGFPPGAAGAYGRILAPARKRSFRDWLGI